MNAWSLVTSLSRQQRNTFVASFLGWALDAFDYFLLTFVTLRIAAEFHVGLPAVIFFSAIGREAKDVDFTKAAERPIERDVDREQYPTGLPQT